MKRKKELAAVEKQSKDNKSLAAEREKNEQEVQALTPKKERTQARINNLQEDVGVVSETDLNDLKQRKKNFEADLEKKEKRISRD